MSKLGVVSDAKPSHNYRNEMKSLSHFTNLQFLMSIGGLVGSILKYHVSIVQETAIHNICSASHSDTLSKLLFSEIQQLNNKRSSYFQEMGIAACVPMSNCRTGINNTHPSLSLPCPSISCRCVSLSPSAKSSQLPFKWASHTSFILPSTPFLLDQR